MCTGIVQGVPGARADPNERKFSSLWDMKPPIVKNARGRKSSTEVRRLSGTRRSRRPRSKKCSCKATATSLDVLMRSGVHLRPMDEVVQGFKVFGDNAAIYAAYILATLEWGRMYHHCGGRDMVPVLPEWLTTYIGVTKSLTTNADLPRKCVHVGNPYVRLNSAATWRPAAVLDRPLWSEAFWQHLLLSQCLGRPADDRHQSQLRRPMPHHLAAYRAQHLQLAERPGVV